MPSAISQARIEANRRNARRSTGPRSSEGKVRSSRNSVSHGIFAKSLVLPGEDPEIFRLFKREIVQRLNPHDVVELQFVEQFVAASWRLKRVRAAETLLYSSRAMTMREEHQMDQLAMIDSGRVRDTNDPLLEDLPRPIPPETMMVQMLQDKDDPALDRLHRYERRLEFTMNRCLKQLRELRQEQQTQSSQYTQDLLDEEDATEDANAQNEPNDAVINDQKVAEISFASYHLPSISADRRQNSIRSRNEENNEPSESTGHENNRDVSADFDHAEPWRRAG